MRRCAPPPRAHVVIESPLAADPGCSPSARSSRWNEVAPVPPDTGADSSVSEVVIALATVEAS
jgi:hypothetical protein